MNAIHERLKKVCSSEYIKEDLIEPHTIELADGQPMTFASNGWIGLWVYQDLGYNPPPTLKPDYIQKIFSERSIQYSVEVAKLKKFAGKNTIPEIDEKIDACENCNGEYLYECPVCEGSGESDYECRCTDCGALHTAACNECEGSGTINCEDCAALERKKVRYGMIDGKCINLNFLALVLEDVEERTISLGGLKADNLKAVYFKGADWHALIMPINMERGSVDDNFPPDYGMPVFPVSSLEPEVA